ncbi:MAG: hypothetical protein EOO81_04780, partial [Oxalobacteraceae bacterium]
FNFIQRKFDIVPGSTIIWTGEPTTAQLNVTALYIANTAPLDLIGDQISAPTTAIRNTYLQKLPFEVRLTLTGELMQPIIDFDMVDKRFIEQGDVLSSLESRPNLLDLTPGEFEVLVANLFSKMGLDTKLTRSSRDGGVDAVAFDTRPVLGGKVVIQAKRYRDTVGISAVRDLYGTMQNEGASKGILVCTSGYGPDAFNFVKNKPLELIDGGGLLYLLREHTGMDARIAS